MEDLARQLEEQMREDEREEPNESEDNDDDGMSEEEKGEGESEEEDSDEEENLDDNVSEKQHSVEELETWDLSSFSLTKHLCICSKKLRLIDDSSLFNAYSQSDCQVTLKCNVCDKRIEKLSNFYRCSANKNHHPKSLNICPRCVLTGKYSKIRQTASFKSKFAWKKKSEESKSASIRKQKTSGMRKGKKKAAKKTAVNTSQSNIKMESIEGPTLVNQESNNSISGVIKGSMDNVMSAIQAKVGGLTSGVSITDSSSNSQAYELTAKLKDKPTLIKENVLSKKRIENLEQQLVAMNRDKSTHTATMAAVKGQITTLMMKNEEMHKQLLNSTSNDIRIPSESGISSDKEQILEERIKMLEKLLKTMFNVFSKRFDELTESVEILEHQRQKSMKSSKNRDGKSKGKNSRSEKKEGCNQETKMDLLEMLGVNHNQGEQDSNPTPDEIRQKESNLLFGELVNSYKLSNQDDISDNQKKQPKKKLKDC